VFGHFSISPIAAGRHAVPVTTHSDDMQSTWSPISKQIYRSINNQPILARREHFNNAVLS